MVSRHALVPLVCLVTLLALGSPAAQEVPPEAEPELPPTSDPRLEEAERLFGVAEFESAQPLLDALVEELAETVRATSLCALGTTAVNPVQSTLKYFRDEYEAHVREKRCPAGVCKELIVFTIDPASCNGCTLCAKHCPQEAVVGEKNELHTIIQEQCIKCGICRDVCNQDAVLVQ